MHNNRIQTLKQIIENSNFFDQDYYLINNPDNYFNESDILLPINKDIKTIISEAPSDWDIIMLGYFSLNINIDHLYKKWENEIGVVATRKFSIKYYKGLGTSSASDAHEIFEKYFY